MSISHGIGLGLTMQRGVVTPMPPSVPVVESYQSNAGLLSTTVVGTKPTGVVSGEFLILIVSNDDSTATRQFLDDVAGWTQFSFGGDAVSDAHFGIYWRKANGTEGATQNVISVSTNDWTTHYLRISGANTITPINASAESSPSSGDAFTCPAITTDVNLCRLIIGMTFDGSDVTYSTIDADYVITDQDGSGGSSGNSACWGQFDQNTAGLTGTPVIDTSIVDGGITFQFAIAPNA